MSAFTNKYSYRKGFAFKVPAQVVGETLDKLAETGTITSQALLDVSRPDSAPTHNLFEWDDTIAAERYRLQQATIAINAIEIEMGETKTPQVAFVNVTHKAPKTIGTFVPINVALSDCNMRDTVLANALRDLKSFYRKYQNLTELSKIFAAIEEVEREVG